MLIPVPPITKETGRFVVNVNGEIHIANTATWRGHAILNPTSTQIDIKYAQTGTLDYPPRKGSKTERKKMTTQETKVVKRKQ